MRAERISKVCAGGAADGFSLTTGAVTENTMARGVASYCRYLVRRLAMREADSGGKPAPSPVFPTYFPIMPGASCYVVPKVSVSPGTPRPVPLRETWISGKYGQTADEYLASGKR